MSISFKAFGFCLLLFFTSPTAFSQRNEFGVFLGGSYYNGELNPRKHFAGVTNPAFGIFHDAHINSRYFWRTMFSYGKLTANDRLTGIDFNSFRDMEFETNLFELSGQIAFNFLSFGGTINEKPYTPYLFIGLAIYNVAPKVTSITSDTTGVAYPKESYQRNFTSVSVPFGFGFKAMAGPLSFGIEWSFRKTFTDKIDGLDNQYETGNEPGDPTQFSHPVGFQKGMFNTDDWYSFAGITISYRPQPKKNACPGQY